VTVAGGDLASAPGGHLRIDARGVVLACNGYLLALVGRTADDVVGGSIDRLFGTPSRIFFYTHVMPTLDASLTISEVQLDLRTADGRDVPVLFNAARATAGADIELAVLAFRNRIAFETELLLAKRAAESAVLEKERAVAEIVRLRTFESLSTLAGGVAHDFNNALCAISGNAQMMQWTMSASDPMRPLLDAIDRAAHDATELSQLMLAYAGGAHLQLAPFGLDDLVTGLRASLTAALPKGVSVAWPACADLRLRGDRMRLHRLLEAVVRNAVESLRPSASPIVMRAGSREFSADELRPFRGYAPLPAGPYVALDVIDEGSGMDAMTRERLFEPFFSTKGMGRGLGLASALGIVRAHAGGIRIASVQGLGTTVSIVLPRLVTPSPEDDLKTT